MAIFRSFLLGDVKKSVANLTMYIAKGVSIVRSKPLDVHNPRTDKQRIQRAKMKALVGLAGGFGPALSIGYPQVVGLKSANNRFVQDNMEIVTVDDGGVFHFHSVSAEARLSLFGLLLQLSHWVVGSTIRLLV